MGRTQRDHVRPGIRASTVHAMPIGQPPAVPPKNEAFLPAEMSSPPAATQQRNKVPAFAFRNNRLLDGGGNGIELHRGVEFEQGGWH